MRASIGNKKNAVIDSHRLIAGIFSLLLFLPEGHQATYGVLMYRAQALSLYRRIFREARAWQNEGERDAIREEARSLFRKNLDLAEDQVPDKLFEGESRVELALHYRVYSPRLSYVQKGTEDHDAESLRRSRVRPRYMDSYDFD